MCFMSFMSFMNLSFKISSAISHETLSIRYYIFNLEEQFIQFILRVETLGLEKSLKCSEQKSRLESIKIGFLEPT